MTNCVKGHEQNLTFDVLSYTNSLAAYATPPWLCMHELCISQAVAGLLQVAHFLRPHIKCHRYCCKAYLWHFRWGRAKEVCDQHCVWRLSNVQRLVTFYVPRLANFRSYAAFSRDHQQHHLRQLVDQHVLYDRALSNICCATGAQK